MAKRFGGFTPQQQQTLLSKMGYTGPAQQDDINKFMMSSPQASSMMGKYAQMAKARVSGGPQIAMQVGGLTLKTGQTYKNTYSGGVEAKGSHPTDNDERRVYDLVKFGNPPPNQPNTTGGFGVGAGQQGQGNMVGTPSGLGDAFAAWSEQTPDETNVRPVGRPVEPPSLYSGDVTNQTLQDILKMTTGAAPVDLQYDFNRDGKITSDDALQAGKVGAGRGTVSEGTDAGGLYDPTQGLPTAVDVDSTVTSLIEANPQDYYVNEIDYEKNKKFAVDQTKALSGNTAIMANPDDYKIEKRGNRYHIVYSDGTAINTEYAGLANAEARAKGVAAGLKAVKPLQDTYNQQLEQYKSYYGQQATVAPEQTRANLDTAQSNLSTEQNLLQQYATQLANMGADDPQRDVIQGLIDEQQIKVTNAKAGLSQAQTNVERVGMPSTTEMRATALEDPASMVTKADVVTVSEAQKAAGKIAEGTGQAGTAATAGTVAAAKAGDVVAPEVKDAATFTAEQTAQQVQDTLNKLTAVTGKPSAEALAEAQSMDPAQLAQLGVTVDQIQQAVTVQAPEARTIQEGELVAGTAVDLERAKVETNFTAATGVPSSEATVQGQLTGLLEQFEGGETPPWAAGAMRAATATLAARGLGASSMAGQAVVQAAMESALPIAMADAQTRASFEAQNLSNRQQAAMFAAEQRSKFLGMEFDQEFQTRVQNAARIADVANINFTAEQQVALENARMAQTVDITNLNAKNAKTMADVAAMAQVDITNLNNRQQSAVQNAQSFLQMDMTNLSNQQQVAMFKAQGNIQSIITDAAATNAAAQFNAASENQTNQFYDNLTSQVAQFNNEQKNAMERFNAGEANAIAQFNAAQKNARDQFNASNALVVEQANAQWEQAITTMDNAAQNAANREAAVVANNLTETTYNNMLQQERDAMDYAWRSADTIMQLESNYMIAEMQTQANVDMKAGEGTGKLTEKVLDFVLGKL